MTDIAVGDIIFGQQVPTCTPSPTAFAAPEPGDPQVVICVDEFRTWSTAEEPTSALRNFLTETSRGTRSRKPAKS